MNYLVNDINVSGAMYFEPNIAMVRLRYRFMQRLDELSSVLWL